jgi:hypothetical protein
VLEVGRAPEDLLFASAAAKMLSAGATGRSQEWRHLTGWYGTESQSEFYVSKN